jgi:uncharacterized protein (TIGR00269 family)
LRHCSVCDREAVYRRPYSGESLCRRCFSQSIEQRTRHTISRFKMFRPDDHIALALSGGKDSVSLLQVLSVIEDAFPRSTLSAILIDEGVDGYRGEAKAIAQENCTRLNVPLHVYSFKTIYGSSLDEIAEAATARGSLSICSYCGVLRRKALNVAAKAVGASKLALAHNLDDEVQSMVLSLLRGDLAGLARVNPVLEDVEGFVQRVKPFCEILEREIAFYAYVTDVRFQRTPCPYRESSMRSDVRRFINGLEGTHAGITYGLAGSLKKIRGTLKDVDARSDVRQCHACGEPSAGTLCRACQSLEELGLT